MNSIYYTFNNQFNYVEESRTEPDVFSFVIKNQMAKRNFAKFLSWTIYKDNEKMIKLFGKHCLARGKIKFPGGMQTLGKIRY